DDVEVAGEPAVLEAVVEDEHLALQLLQGNPGERDAVGALQVRDVGQVLLQQQRLVVGAVVTAVPPAEDGDAEVPFAVEVGDVLDAGGLAGAADGEVADADDGGADAPGAEQAAVVGEVAQADRQAVGQAQAPQGQAPEAGPRAARLAGHQRQVA